MSEQNMTECRICKQLKLRIQDGKYNTKDKRWKDSTGGLWNGHYCPDCNRERIKSKMRLKRQAS
jgi:hypothetical protein